MSFDRFILTLATAIAAAAVLGAIMLTPAHATARAQGAATSLHTARKPAHGLSYTVHTTTHQSTGWHRTTWTWRIWESWK